MPTTRIHVISSAMTNAGRLKPISTPKILGAASRSCARCTSSVECAPLIASTACIKACVPGSDAGILRQRHLPRHRVLGCTDSRPVVVGQPQRHIDLENLEKLDEVVRPARRNRAGTHGVFQRQVPADDPREQFTQRGIARRYKRCPPAESSRQTPRNTVPQKRIPVQKVRTRASRPGPA